MKRYFIALFIYVFLIVIALPGHAFERTKLSSPDRPIANELLQDSVAPGLLPAPQRVSFSGKTFTFDRSWKIILGDHMSPKSSALQSLQNQLTNQFHIALKTAAEGRTGRAIHLEIRPNAVTIGQATDTNRTALKEQAYQLTLDPKIITISANDSAGLFYGVQTFIQLIKKRQDRLLIPEGDITDWPDLALRAIYWDDAHHLERLPALKKAIRRASYFKINGFALKLEGHFQYKSAQPIVEPYALSAKEYQQLTDYALAHQVQLIPYLDAPAHDSFILKHPEYAHLRAFPKSNYEFCVAKKETYELLSAMLTELMDANQGGKYMLLSTDEPYYIGQADNRQCNEKALADSVGGKGALLAKFITDLSKKIHDQGRKTIFWGEYPLTEKNIDTLPSHLINGVYNGDWAARFKNQGIRQLIYTSTQGVEPLFPSYYPLSAKSQLNPQNKKSTGRVEGLLQTISSSMAEGKSDYMGTIVAGWGDSGLHPETFWLGYATGSAAGWNHGSFTAEQLTQRFFRSFYGSESVKIKEVYRLLSEQAQFWGDSWEWKESTSRTPIWGNSYKIFDPPVPAKDQTLAELSVPSANNLSLSSDWNKENTKRLKLAAHFVQQNNRLLDLLYQNLGQNPRNRYNIELMLSVAKLCRQNLNMLLDFKAITTFLKQASMIGSKNPRLALSLMDNALKQAMETKTQRNKIYQSVVSTWYESWQPRVTEANGRQFLDKVDDVKDHLPVRTVDMSYLIYRELQYPLGRWYDRVVKARNTFAQQHDLSLLSEEKTLEWGKTNLAN